MSIIRQTIVIALAAASALAAAAQAEEGAPNSPERQAYCKVERSKCQSAGQLNCGRAYSTCLTAPAGTGAAPSPGGTGATASGSCDATFAKLRQAPQVALSWVTNYFAHGYRFVGSTQLTLRLQGQDLFASGQRNKYAHSAGTFQTNVPMMAQTILSQENVSLRIRGDGTIMFNDMYGPYTPTCWGDRFAGLHSGDSIETFTFTLP